MCGELDLGFISKTDYLFRPNRKSNHKLIFIPKLIYTQELNRKGEPKQLNTHMRQNMKEEPRYLRPNRTGTLGERMCTYYGKVIGIKTCYKYDVTNLT